MDPPFTINDLKAAIPAHCFERDLKKSFAYVAIDVIGIIFTFWLASFIPSFSLPLQFILWPAYWIIQGFTFTGIVCFLLKFQVKKIFHFYSFFVFSFNKIQWVIAHECGHQAFSDSKQWNNAVGLVLHSALLVPYHSWRFTHGNHHKATGHLTRDQVFVPSRYSKVMKDHSLWEDTPIMNLYKTVIMVLFGWPFYLMFNVVSQTYPGQRANHFEPWSPLFKQSQRQEVVISDVALAVVFAILYLWASYFSWSTVFFYYFVPYLSCNFWLVTITYLQHTHVEIPHYTNDEWTFIKGALTTIDRDYGILNYWFHHIQDTHILHHLFSTIPHYHAEVCFFE